MSKMLPYPKQGAAYYWMEVDGTDSIWSVLFTQQNTEKILLRNMSQCVGRVPRLCRLVLFVCMFCSFVL